MITNLRAKRKLYFLLMMVIAFLTASVTSYSEIYKWIDEDGRVQYSDKPQAGAKILPLKGRVSSYESVTYEGVDGYSVQPTPNKKQKIVMYSTSWCGYCKKASKYFKSKGIPFVEYDIEKNKKAKRDYDDLGGSGVPVILLGKKRMNGFSVKAFERFYQK